MTQSAQIRAAIDATGCAMGPDVIAGCRQLFGEEQMALVAAVPPVASDVPYGPDARHVLDIYAPVDARDAPVVVFVHGGGFVLGSKCEDGWANAAVGRWAATQGMVGVVINYRLAPDHLWPAGGADVGAAVDWVRANIGAYGGDPARIVAMGTSAGAVHVAGFLSLRPDHADLVRGAVLLSGLYGYTPLDVKDERYYGAPEDYPARMPREGVAATTLPLFVAAAQYDPQRFQAEFLGLMTERNQRHGTMPLGHIANGHNHYSMAMHIGTSDTRLSAEVADFITRVCA
ncbi:carboxylesterase family protein [Novosphingobium sp. FSY-8]|uniref:Carboxylesterase family protein n=1 Tax=Novosphingobium ovatum TaxID=1908523 RepID=A0ABW9XI58_9SPHN|nr:alpha/beta hydrolase [Novosphingobium ovatum]NBC38138.1 carboxylesterase family protein [Novosphingobium ovatum]